MRFQGMSNEYAQKLLAQRLAKSREQIAAELNTKSEGTGLVREFFKGVQEVLSSCFRGFKSLGR